MLAYSHPEAIYCYRTSYARQWATDNGYGGIVHVIDPYVASGSCGDSLTWTLDEDGLLTISGTGAMTDWDSANEIPWFSYQSQISSVDIQDGVTSIGNRAFMFANLTSVVIPASVTEIGGMAFYHCGSLTSVSIPENVTEIGWSCFEGCSGLTSLTLPDGITFLGVSAFEGCAGLASVNIPTGLDDINSNLFSQCTSLSSITIPEGVRIIGSGVFMDCANLTDVFIPTDVTHIADNAFDNCPNLRIHCPLGSYAASWALDKGIPVVYILPEGIVASGDCGDNLTWTLDENGLLTISGTGAMRDFASESSPWHDHADAITAVVLPDELTSIGSAAFADCAGLTDITIPAGVTSIGSDAFASCASLTEIVLPEGIASIADDAFNGWPHAEDGTIYCARTSYTESWAAGNDSCTIVFFDEAWAEPTYEWAEDHRSVTATRVGLFDDSMVETETTTVIDMDCEEEPTETECGRTSYWAYFENEAFDTWCDALDIPPLSELNVLRLPASLTEIEAEAFMGGSFDAVILPEGCERIGEYAFANCPNLMFAHFPMGVEFEMNAFDGCDNFRWPVFE